MHESFDEPIAIDEHPLRAGVLTLLLGLGSVTAKLLGGIARLRRSGMTADVSYADGVRHKLDVYQPRGGAAPAPVIVFFYGGSWELGSRETYRFLAAALAARGYVVVVPDYRLYPEVKFPEFLEDSAKAFRWVRDNIATFQGDPSRLFVMGHSAGAYNAAMLALDAKWLNAVGLEPNRDIAGLIGISGPYDFLPLRDRTLSIIFGGDNRETQPISFAEGRKPPAILLTGAADDTVNSGNSVRLAAELRRNGNDATELVYPRLGHFTIMAGFTPFVARFFPPLNDVDAFVARVRPDAPQAASILVEVAAPPL